MKSQKLKVFIDQVPLRSGHAARGIGSYIRNLVDALNKGKEVKLVGNIGDADLVHYPYFDLFFLTLPLSKPKSTVVTIHDVIPLIYPEHYKQGIKGWLKFQMQKRSLKNVDAIITDSETSKKDILRFLDVPQDKIHIIHLAPSPSFKKIAQKNSVLPRTVEKYNLPEKFILYVGDVNYNKNIPGLLHAFKILSNHPTIQSSNLKLVLVGGAFQNKTLTETQNIFELINRLKLEDKVIITGFVPGQDLVCLYNLATVYCQPSFYEGFGLPVLEAMKCGCPVVAGKTQSLVEIAEGAALFVNPKDPNNISDGLLKVLSDQTTKTILIKQGIVHVKKFSWEKTAQETIDVYKKISHG